jgi:putative ABC transport system permease protein
VKATPGVVSTSLSAFTPISGSSVDLPARVDGYIPQQNENTSVLVNYVSPGYFETLRTPLLAGRDFNQQDTSGNTQVALISEATMKHFFAGVTPLGRRLRLGDRNPVEIIGVVKDAKYLSLREPVQGTVYLNCLQMNNMAGNLTLTTRTIRDPSAVASSLRKEISSMNSTVPVSVTGTLADQIDRSLIQERLVATLSGFFAMLALLLACVGLYGVMSYNVVRRTSEIGIRMALGAQRGEVIRMVLSESLFLVVFGVAIGIPLALGATRLVSSQISGLLFGLSATDVRIMGLAIVVLSAVTMLAACLPARRATRVDPLIALRDE